MAAIDDHANLQVCLDYSFYKLVDLKDLIVPVVESPRKVVHKKGKVSNPLKKNEDGLYLANNLKLNNNSLQEFNEFLGELSTYHHIRDYRQPDILAGEPD